jgi:hypothetical protein
MTPSIWADCPLQLQTHPCALIRDILFSMADPPSTGRASSKQPPLVGGYPSLSYIPDGTPNCRAMAVTKGLKKRPPGPPVESAAHCSGHSGVAAGRRNWVHCDRTLKRPPLFAAVHTQPDDGKAVLRSTERCVATRCSLRSSLIGFLPPALKCPTRGHHQTWVCTLREFLPLS